MYAKSKHLKEAATYMRKMQIEDHLTPAPQTFGEMVLGLARIGDVNSALALMTDIKRRNLPIPDERYLRPLRIRLHVGNLHYY